MTLRVLHVSKEFEPSSSGVARHIQGLVQALQGLDGNIQLSILAPVIGATVGDLDVRQGGYRQLWSALERTDVLHIHGARTPIAAFAACLALLRGVPLVYTPHCYYDTGGVWLRLFKRAWDKTIERLLVRRAAAVVLLHEGWRADLARRGLRPSNVLIIPNCIDDRRQPGAAAPPPLDGSPALLCVGRLDPVKRINDVIAALHEPALARAVLHIVGQGADHPRLQALTAQWSLQARVRFHGWQEDRVAQQMMAACDAMVLASEREGMPTIVLEALLAGVPIACSDAEGCLSITKVVGWDACFAVGDRAALAECAAHCANLVVPAEVREAVSAGFTWQRKAPELATVYIRAAARTRPTGWMKRLARHLSNYDNPRSLGSRLRAKRIGPLLALIDQAYARHGRVDLIDVGGTPYYWNMVPETYLASRRVSITLVNTEPLTQPPRNARFTWIEADGCDLSRFKDGAFHIAHSNSVIEHVGDRARVEQFAHELMRVADHYFVQTPDFWCAVEPHCMTPFFHWLPRRLRLWLVSSVALGHWPRATSTEQAVRLVDSARLLTHRQMQVLFPSARIIRERILGLPKSLIAVSP